MNLDALNNEQREGVLETEGPVLILAGAGSGKTRVLTQRIAYLIEEKAVYSSYILAITFTNKAAKEMKSRVERLIGPKVDGMWMGTFHSVCVRILRRDCERIGYDRNFVIFDPTDQLALIKDIYKALKIDEKTNPHRMILSKISEAKNEMISSREYEGAYGDGFRDKIVAKCFAMYEKRLKECNAMDFDDLISNAVELLENNEDVREYYQKKFKYIHVDEYQDTNKSQYLLIKLLTGASKNLCVVGDTDQSIYGWRGADIRNIRDFELDFPGAKVIKLEQNYRSYSNILRAANCVIKNNSNRHEKNLWSEKGEGEKIHYYCGSNEHDEARFVADRIVSLKHREKRRLSDFAILYRTNAQSRVLEDALRRENISYKLLGGLKFYDRKEIKDVMSYLRLISNLVDDISFYRVVNTPKRGLGLKALEKISEISRDYEISAFEAALKVIEEDALTKGASKNLKDFLDLIMEMKEGSSTKSPSEILEEVLAKTGIIQLLKNEDTIESKSRIENIKELVGAVIEFENENPENATLEKFLEENTLRSDIDGMDEENDSVVLMTLHTAKGLEFPVVFITGLEERIFPTSRAVDGTGNADGMEEERRLAYVGITRAEEILYLTHSITRALYGEVNYNQPSRFISEIEMDLLENDGGSYGIFKKAPTKSEAKSIKDFDNIISRNKEREERIFGATEDGQSFDNIKAGTKVSHGIFGKGTVISVVGEDSDKTATVAFESKGIKRLKLAFAGLKPL